MHTYWVVPDFPEREASRTVKTQTDLCPRGVLTFVSKELCHASNDTHFLRQWAPVKLNHGFRLLDWKRV